MTTATNTIPEQLKRAFKPGHDARERVKKVPKLAPSVLLWGLPITVAIWFFVFFLPDMAANVTKYVATPPQTQAQQPAVTPKKVIRTDVKWKNLQTDGTIPVNVWSEKMKLPVMCRSDLEGGYGQVYVAQTWDYEKGDWVDVEPAKDQPAEELRFKVLKEGMKSLPFVIECRR